MKQTVSQIIVLKFNYPQAIKQQQILQQVKAQQNPHKIQAGQVVSQGSQINPSLIQSPPVSDRVPLGSSFGTRPSAVVSPVKGTINPSFAGSARVGEMSGVTQSFNQSSQSANRVSQQQVPSSTSGGVVYGTGQSAEGRYKRSDIKTEGVRHTSQNN